MAFGIKRKELNDWKEKVKEGNEVVFITHYWLHPRFPEIKTVTKAGCANHKVLEQWGQKYGLKSEWIHKREQYPHFDLIGDMQVEILLKEGMQDQVERFSLQK
ncbi:hypothetical protein [Bacillus suaedaesalsae]|uniref:YneQ n=1 Tax=Bacillus suaedaesalsae TaxID=2810349 RepID=A0ABS2DMZ6_9BACI|nr:hypothetical protein [Bacillus suaedaesalsae]